VQEDRTQELVGHGGKNETSICNKLEVVCRC